MVGKASPSAEARRPFSGKKTRSRFSIAKGMPPPVETPKSRAAARREGGARSARRGRRGARDRLTGAGSSRPLDGRTGNAAYSPDQSVRSTARSSPARRMDEGEVFGVSETARRVGGGFRRGNARAVRVRRKTSLRVLARGGDGGDAPRYRGRDRIDTDLRGSRGPRPRCSPCPFGSSRAVALRRTGVATVSHERAGENIKPCDTTRGARARRKRGGRVSRRARPRAVARAPMRLHRARGKARGARHRSTRVSVVTSRSPAPKSADRERRDAGGWHVHTGTTVVSSSSPLSPFCVCASS